MPKYIKGKDGKFKGSIPDMGSAPSTISNLPKKAAHLDKKVARGVGKQPYEQDSHSSPVAEYFSGLESRSDTTQDSYFNHDTESFTDAHVDYAEGNNIISIGSEVSKSLSGVAMPDSGDNNILKAEILNIYFDSRKTLEEKRFTNMSEAKVWIAERLNARTQLVGRFHELVSDNPDKLKASLEAKLSQSGRGDLTPIRVEKFIHSEGVEVNGSIIKVDKTKNPFTAAVNVSKNDNTPFTGEHEFHNNDDMRAVMYGLFVAFSE
jgi:hypothetical protein